MPLRVLLAVGLLAIVIQPVRALCVHRGTVSAKTTIPQEFSESRWVVRARVVSADEHWSDKSQSWVLYKLMIIERFKGNLPINFSYFSERNSGGFYLESKKGTPDLGSDYLLFLVSNAPSRLDPSSAKRAGWINYNCGQSKSWAAMTRAETLQLRALSVRR